MDKITLTLSEIYNLDAELNGLTNSQTNEVVFVGLLKEKLSLVTKYWLNDLSKKTSAEKQSIESLKDELIRKYGETDDKGGITIPIFIENGLTNKKIINPNYQKFDKEFAELMQTKKEIEYKQFELSEFSEVTTSDNYNIFFKLVKA